MDIKIIISPINDGQEACANGSISIIIKIK